MKDINAQDKNQRVVTFLNREEVDFLDKLGKDALFSTGLKLSRAKLISWLVDFIKELNIQGENLQSEKDFISRIKKTLPPATEEKDCGGVQ
jgi:hypothetical protein